ncbi:hypothetical protein [Streptomyces fulvorobeus]|uniref:Uncharacterized protein n=1 Tax=Streptomyces fulvorobeus TaxID=284028 RepID=A0A7J0BZH7_9ACTN|nr:hypothetical protein [Streptomyces fulvorobeus]NYE39424.1 hypothetical protein [Streptomyces fulvorobeus]GFM95652.1 hypothetical protein Sfulv_04630 [Streptomyces fulvorobeus]
MTHVGSTPCCLFAIAVPAIADISDGGRDGTINPGEVFGATADLDGVPASYQDMADKSLKVLVKP